MKLRSGTRRCWPLGVLAGAVLLGTPAWANHFTARRLNQDGQERGIVASHGMDLFEITTTAGGYSPARRAEIIAGRLEELSETHEATAEMFSVGFRNGEVILQQQEHTMHLPHLVVTIDRALAQRAAVAADRLPTGPPLRSGSPRSVERLAQWWLALLRDHLCLAAGRMPVHTTETPVAPIFEKLYLRLGSPTDPVPSPEIDRAVAALPPSERELFRTAASAVPESYSPDRVIVVYAPPPGEAAGHREVNPQRENAGPPPSEAPPARVEPDREPAAAAAPSPPAGDASAVPEERPASAENVRRVGRYEVRLIMDPSPAIAGRETVVDLQVTRTAAGEAQPGSAPPLTGADVNGWFLAAGQEQTRVRAKKAHTEGEDGVYGWHVRFTKSGQYRLVLEIAPPDEDKFNVEFPFAVGPAGAAAVKPENRSKQRLDDATSGVQAGEQRGQAQRGRSGSPPPRAAPPRDRLRAELTSDGQIEVAWPQTDPPPKAVTFLLLDGEGKTLETYRVTTAPFSGQFPRRASAYFAAGLTQIQATAEYSDGVKTQLVVPFEKPSSQRGGRGEP